jgi:hypothetical protein
MKLRSSQLFAYLVHHSDESCSLFSGRSNSVSPFECRRLSAFPQAVGSILTEETRAAWSNRRGGPNYFCRKIAALGLNISCVAAGAGLQCDSSSSLHQTRAASPLKRKVWIGSAPDPLSGTRRREEWISGVITFSVCDSIATRIPVEQR